jgi:hypothetical protein
MQGRGVNGAIALTRPEAASTMPAIRMMGAMEVMGASARSMGVRCIAGQNLAAQYGALLWRNEPMYTSTRTQFR